MAGVGGAAARSGTTFVGEGPTGATGGTPRVGVSSGRGVGAALRHLDGHGSEPEALGVAEALARFLVARCESHHAGWRVVRQVVVDSTADAPWETRTPPSLRLSCQ